MKTYNKPTLVVNNYNLAKVSICKVSNVVDVEKPDWGIGAGNGIINTFK